ncbi:hypothetical protein PV726_30930 [Streptomyces europaeiscabiei]|uniref:hypothetical protein n=1 Tax=Streptomyces europaeiscabiei TaxID=146819 RepID=UPI0029B4EADB|nr:hypothetical protein [Streptomyces europaeiscabiei]MDX3694670.1 hypothetical protein [Streptomyces europaeiscabiei]
MQHERLVTTDTATVTATTARRARTHVAARTRNAHHPLPWIDGEVSEVGRPDAKAPSGTRVTRTGKGDGESVRVPLHVPRATDFSAPRFER